MAADAVADPSFVDPPWTAIQDSPDAHPQQPAAPVFDFDEASRAWTQNKTRAEEGDEWEYARQVGDRVYAKIGQHWMRAVVSHVKRAERQRAGNEKPDTAVVNLEEHTGEHVVSCVNSEILCWSTLKIRPTDDDSTLYTSRPAKNTRPKRKRASICYRPQRRKATAADKHNDVCDRCDLGGELLCCDSCTLVWHLGCLDPPITEVPEGTWECPVCMDEKDEFSAQHEDDCAACGEGGELLCCDGCPRAFHLSCCKPPLKKIPEGSWLCGECKPSTPVQASKTAKPIPEIAPLSDPKPDKRKAPPAKKVCRRSPKRASHQEDQMLRTMVVG